MSHLPFHIRKKQSPSSLPRRHYRHRCRDHYRRHCHRSFSIHKSSDKDTILPKAKCPMQQARRRHFSFSARWHVYFLLSLKRLLHLPACVMPTFSVQPPYQRRCRCNSSTSNANASRRLLAKGRGQIMFGLESTVLLVSACQQSGHGYGYGLFMPRFDA